MPQLCHVGLVTRAERTRRHVGEAQWRARGAQVAGVVAAQRADGVRADPGLRDADGAKSSRCCRLGWQELAHADALAQLRAAPHALRPQQEQEKRCIDTATG